MAARERKAAGKGIIIASLKPDLKLSVGRGGARRGGGVGAQWMFWRARGKEDIREPRRKGFKKLNTGSAICGKISSR